MDAEGERIIGVQRWDAIVQSLPLYCIERRRFSNALAGLPNYSGVYANLVEKNLSAVQVFLKDVFVCSDR
jgi:hypothetical protein